MSLLDAVAACASHSKLSSECAEKIIKEIRIEQSLLPPVPGLVLKKAVISEVLLLYTFRNNSNAQPH